MRTHAQTRGSAGASDFDWFDGGGRKWRVSVQWAFIGGRVEAAALSLDSGGAAPITSSLVREVERVVRDKRTERAKQVRRLARTPGTVGKRASRQIEGWQAPSAASPGKRTDHDLWRHRSEVIRDAWERREPLLAALETDEPGKPKDSYRKMLDRARKWDQQTGAGLLDGVGRPRGRNTK